MLQRPILALLVLAACDSPSPWMSGAEATAFVAEGYDMTLWLAGDQVEVIRHGYAPRADQPRLRTAMARAIPDLTGCGIYPGSLEGDSGVLRARLDCG
ncbi:MAG: hypothetical protein JJT99_05685 [Rhodobacteraceae bacterium]|nr:hypothetical protein [Paracoccaceae bacterium]